MSKENLQAYCRLAGKREMVLDGATDLGEFLVFTDEDSGRPVAGKVIRVFNLVPK